MPESNLKAIIDERDVDPRLVIADCLTMLMRQDRVPDKNILRHVGETRFRARPQSDILCYLPPGGWYIGKTQDLSITGELDTNWITKLKDVRVAWSKESDKDRAQSDTLINFLKPLYASLLWTIQQIEFRELAVFRKTVSETACPSGKVIPKMFYGQLSEVAAEMKPQEDDKLMLFVPARLWSDLFLDDLMKTNYLPPPKLPEALSKGHVGRLRLPSGEVDLYSDSVLLSATRLAAEQDPQEILLISPHTTRILTDPHLDLAFHWQEGDHMHLSEVFQLLIPAEGAIHRFTV